MAADHNPVQQSQTREPTEPRNICLFGGTFDPIHLGHTHIAQAAVDELLLDQVIFLPCRQSPHKQGLDHASANHRLEMCRLATAGFDWARVDDHDLTSPAPSYSWRTAEAMAERHPGVRLFWLMGTDQWQALPRWNRPDHLASLVEFIVFTRGEAPEPRAGYHLHSITGNHPASATAIRNGFKADQGQASSTQPHYREWLDPQVSAYIIAHQLYENNEPLR